MSNEYSQKLINQNPLVVLPCLAQAFGLEKAIVLQQFQFMIQQRESGVIIDGKKYVWKSAQEFCGDYAPFWHPKTLARYICELEKDGVLISIKPKAKFGNQTKYYRINYKKIEEAEAAFPVEPPSVKKKSPGFQIPVSEEGSPFLKNEKSSSQNREISEFSEMRNLNTEITTENTSTEITLNTTHTTQEKKENPKEKSSAPATQKPEVKAAEKGTGESNSAPTVSVARSPDDRNSEAVRIFRDTYRIEPNSYAVRRINECVFGLEALELWREMVANRVTTLPEDKEDNYGYKAKALELLLEDFPKKLARKREREARQLKLESENEAASRQTAERVESRQQPLKTSPKKKQSSGYNEYSTEWKTQSFSQRIERYRANNPDFDWRAFGRTYIEAVQNKSQEVIDRRTKEVEDFERNEAVLEQIRARMG